MARVKLTKGIVEAEPPGTKDAYIWDQVLPRFGVRITPAGTRVYLVQYRVRTPETEQPVTRRMTIGQHGRPWTIEAARGEARKLLAAVDLGRDPFGEREKERVAERAAREAEELQAKRRQFESFASIADRYIAQRATHSRTWAETARLLRFGLEQNERARRRSGHRTDSRAAAPGPVKAWGERHISDISRADVADLIDAVRQRSPAVARATYAALRPLFEWCVERDLIQHSPCERLRAPPRPQARDRVLTEEEIRVVWLAAKRLGHPFGEIVQLLLLTGQRRSEVAELTWDEIDIASAKWRLPAQRTKNSKAHELDLNPEAIAILDRIERTGPYLFPARGDGPARGFAAAKRRLDTLVHEAAAELGLEPPAAWRLHDLRRTAATGMAGLGFAPHVVERVLNHISGAQGGLVGVYQRHEYRPERRAAMTAWGSHVADLVEGRAPSSNVISLRP